jgi:hypothetical protein
MDAPLLSGRRYRWQFHGAELRAHTKRLAQAAKTAQYCLSGERTALDVGERYAALSCPLGVSSTTAPTVMPRSPGANSGLNSTLQSTAQGCDNQ